MVDENELKTELKTELNKCRKRFKGVENFLRRVAFNLGNTPSQTEVKIISCIPIDVTDLQQKIIQLERQLEDVRNAKQNFKEDTVSVTTARSTKSAKDNGNENKRRNTKEDIKNVNGEIVEVKDKLRKSSKGENNAKDSNLPPNATSVHTAFCRQKFSRLHGTTDSTGSELPEDSLTSRFNGSSSFQKYSTASSMFPTTSAIPNGYKYELKDNSKMTGEHWSPKDLRNLFSKMKKPRKNKTHFVYYAQTDRTPFNNYEMTPDSLSNYHEVLGHHYLSEVIKKQYQPVPVKDYMSDGSKYTSPICRDEYLSPDSCPYETDICSCFQGMFYNVDNYLLDNDMEPTQLKVNYSNIYNDSSLYDVIPVKEKQFNTFANNSPKEKKSEIVMKCWPETVRVKPHPQHVIVNYHTEARCKENHINTRSRRSNNLIRQRHKRNKKQFREQKTGMSSNSYSVDLSQVYTKIIPKTKNAQTSGIIKQPLLQHSKCLNAPINNVQPQVLTKIIGQENKTQVTLGQIKNILQTVLTEVRESTMKNVEEKTKKDATVQKGSSQSNMREGSSLLNSFTYSPFNMSPYPPTCSRQMASNLCCYPGHSPMHNYPLIIQTPGRHLCSSCFKNSHYKPTGKTMPTNSDKLKEQRYKETDKLIREIYKSVALDIPTKDTSLSEYNIASSNNEKEADLKIIKIEDKKIVDVVSEIFRNRNINTDTSESNAVSTTVHDDSVGRNSKLSTIHSNNTQTDFPKEDKNIQLSMDTGSDTAVESNPKTVDKGDNKRIFRSGDDCDEVSSSETDSDTVVPMQKTKVKKKTGIFSKMMNMFNKKKTDDKIKAQSETESSDSDDYQTVYSHKDEKPRRTQRRVIQISKQPHSKIVRPKRSRNFAENKNKRKPYMEQEYRRRWNEKIMFENEKIRHSSEQPFWWETTKRPKYEPIYRQNVEARSVFVEPVISPRHFGAPHRFTTYTTPNAINCKPFRPYAADYFNIPTRQHTQQHPFRSITRFNDGIVRTPYVSTNNRDLTKPNFDQSEKIKPGVGLKKYYEERKPSKGLSWLKKYNMGIRCGDQWKKFILES
ncbi:uncharacterized protein LOC101735536 [Bombyx mori]|uniref:Uncharacterized protein n=1 Tax=Bombyx mori TaxID=7091 RepID=A0A8R1WDW8_BOMMO|nr:uncharacterized protein LOC101735536 [Bombyx mori]